MAKRNRKPKQRRPRAAQESPGAEVVTVAWTVSVTSVFLSLLIAVAANRYIHAFPPAVRMQTFEGLALFVAAISGLVSLLLVGVVVQVRRVRPPQGLLAFSILLAVAAIVAVVYRLAR